MTSQTPLPDEASRKLRSKLEGAISIAYLLSWALLLKSTSWLFGDVIDERFGSNSGLFGLTILLPTSFLVAAIIVLPCSYWAITWAYGRDVAEETIFRWRKKK